MCGVYKNIRLAKLYTHFDCMAFTDDLLEEIPWSMTSPLTIFSFQHYKTKIFHVAVVLFSSRWKMRPKCGKNISNSLGSASCATFSLSPHFDFWRHLHVIFRWTDAGKHGICLLNDYLNQYRWKRFWLLNIKVNSFFHVSYLLCLCTLKM